MATRMTILWLLAFSFFAAAALAEVALAVATTSSSSSSSSAAHQQQQLKKLTADNQKDQFTARGLHQRIVKSLKGKWTTMWEFPVQQKFVAAPDAAADADVAMTDALFVNDLAANGFAFAKINGTIGWLNSRTGFGPHSEIVVDGTAKSEDVVAASTIEKATGPYGELATDDALVWTVARPDHSSTDNLALFEVPSSSSAVSSNFYLPFLDSFFLSQFQSFNGHYGVDKEDGTDAPDAPSIANGLRRSTDASASSSSSTDAAPSYGYVLCSVDTAYVPLNPIRSEEGDTFTKGRRVVLSDAPTAKSSYMTQTSAYKGVIFQLEAPSSNKRQLSAEEAEKKYCGSSAAIATATTTPLTITTIGAPFDDVAGTTAPLFSLFDSNNGRINSGYWHLDSVSFEFGLLPHERKDAGNTNKKNAAAAAAGKLKETAKDESEDGEENTTSGDAAAIAADVKGVLAKYSKDQIEHIAAASNGAMSDHPLLAALKKKAEEKEKEGSDDALPLSAASSPLLSSLIKHRIVLRRVYRPDTMKVSLAGSLVNLWDSYWHMLLIAAAFVTFRFYVGYRYSNKKLQSSRKVLAKEEAKFLKHKQKKD